MNPNLSRIVGTIKLLRNIGESVVKAESASKESSAPKRQFCGLVTQRDAFSS
jgi:hypothetical protein